jgi:hypothetical protein
MRSYEWVSGTLMLPSTRKGLKKKEEEERKKKKPFLKEASKLKSS